MEKPITTQQRSCRTCKYEDQNLYDPPCKDCVDSKQVIKFNPIVNCSKWKKKEN